MTTTAETEKMASNVTKTNMVDPDWWRQASVYQVYPRSFADANGDGVGDIKGIISRLPYLEALGVDAIWLSPFYTSPQLDAGYDVSDYRGVDPRFGTLQDFEEMVKFYKEAGIRTIVDLVPNHSSDQHPWFKKALASPRGSDARAKYHFRDGVDMSEPPADWDCSVGGYAWHPVDDGQYYFGLYGPFQPDLNWDHPEIQEDFIKTIRFWADRGVAGFRVDVATGMDKDFRDPLPPQKLLSEAAILQRENGCPPNIHPYNDRDGVFEIYKTWRKVFNEYTPPLMGVAEAWVAQDRTPLYADSKGLGQAFSFSLLLREFDREQYKDAIDTSIRMAREAGSTTTWVLSNHDMIRHATRYGFPKVPGPWTNESHFNVPCESYLTSLGKVPGFDQELGAKKARAASLFMLALPGSAYLYQGEEIGLPEVLDIPPEKRQDPVYLTTKGRRIGRDGCRVPLPWTLGKNFGFGAGEEPHLPQPRWWGEFSVEKQETDPRSSLNLYRRALALRRQLQRGEELEWKSDDPRILHLKRSEVWEVLLNFSDESVEIPKGEILVASSEVEGQTLPPHSAVWFAPE